MKKRSLKSFFVVIFMVLIIAVTVTVSLDLCGVITLPKKLSLKTYLSNTVEVMGFADSSEIYYPDYDGTGVQDLIVTESNSGVQNSTQKYEDPNGELAKTINDLQTSQGQTKTYISPTENITDNSFYYNQLDTYGKTIYSRLYSNLDNLKNGDYTIDYGYTFNELLQSPNGESTLTNAFQLSINALLLDHPEIFYLDVTKMYMFTESTTTIRGTTYKISIGPDTGVSYLSSGFNSRSDVLIAEDNIKTILYKIKSGLSGSTLNKIKQVHNYLVDTIIYDGETNSELSHGIYGALINQYAVCDGYTKAFKYILDDLGISCVEVCGIAENSSGVTESHAWNDILIDGNWYAIDVTWDDPIIVGGNGTITDEIRYNYFLKGSNSFYPSHKEDGFIVTNGEFKYPVISETDY